MKKVLLLFFVACLCFMMASMPYVTKKSRMHDIATIARDAGVSEDDPLIQRAKELWWEADKQYATDRDAIATLLYNEAWGGCSTRHRELVAAVVLNRVNSSKYPNTVYDVIAQPGQYLKAYVTPGSRCWNAARADASVWSECQTIAARALHGEIDCPEDILYQANFRQGNGTYETHATSYSTTYFCYG